MQLDQHLEEFTRRDWETTTPDTLRVAVVGLGEFARRRALPAIDESDYCEVGATVSGDRQKADGVADEYDATPLTYGEYGRGTGREDYDAVYVITPNAVHLPHVETAAELGKHVLCEKPLEADADRAAAVVQTCEKAAVTLMTAYRLQADPAIRRAREVVDSGALGDVVHASGEFSFHVLGGDRSPDQWRLDPDLAGGGALYDIGVYPLNTTGFLLGTDPVAVSASVRSPDPEYDVDEHAAVRVAFDGGVVGAFTVSYNAQPVDTLSLVGTEGRLAIDPAYDTERNRQLVIERGDEQVTYEGDYVNEIAEQLDYFAHAVHTGAQPEPDGEEGHHDVRALEAILTADREGRHVEL